jgi:hypothetical protein
MKGEDTLDGRCVRAMIGARIRPPHDNGRRHLREGVRAVIEAPVQTVVWLRAKTPKEKVCGPQYEPSSEQPQSQYDG